VRLPDGSVLILESVKIGRTNEFLHGKTVERVFGRLLPTNGVSLPYLELQPPSKKVFYGPHTTSLTAKFRLSGKSAASNELVRSSFHRQFRAIIVGEDGFEYVNEFWPFEKLRDGYFSYLSTTLFQRDSNRLRFRVERRNRNGGSWEVVAEFVADNQPAVDAVWIAEKFPATRLTDGMEITLGEVRVQPEPFNASDIWKQSVSIPFQIRMAGMLLTNWDTHDLVIRDSSGNVDHFGSIKVVTNGWIIERVWRSLDPRKIWRIEANLAQDSDFTATNLFTLRIPVSLSTLVTNIDGFPLRGSLNDNWLSVELLTNKSDLRLSLVQAQDQNGTNIAEWSGSWAQFRFNKSLSLPAPGGEVIATLAIHKNVKAEFTIKPLLIRADQSPAPGDPKTD
jgi:hypothetical protein